MTTLELEVIIERCEVTLQDCKSPSEAFILSLENTLDHDEAVKLLKDVAEELVSIYYERRREEWNSMR